MSKIHAVLRTDTAQSKSSRGSHSATVAIGTDNGVISVDLIQRSDGSTGYVVELREFAGKGPSMTRGKLLQVLADGILPKVTR